MYKNRIWVYSFLLIITLAGCELFNLNNEKRGLSPEELQSQLVEKNWELRTILKDGYGTYAPEKDSMYTIRFSKDSTFTAYEICNQCGGSYQINEDADLLIEGIACTEMACYGYQHSTPFSSDLSGEVHPATIQDGKLLVTVGESSNQKTYQFAEYETLKEVILARPQSTSDFDFSAWPNSDHHKIDASVSGDSLYVKVGYSGCGLHELNLVAYDYFTGTEPAQAKAFVSHTAEACRAVFSAHETFSLMPLKEAYQESIGSSGSIQLIIGENGMKTDTVLYSF